MQSKAATVDDYFLEIPVERLVAMKKLRKLFLQELRGYEEKMAYGGPCYAKNNVIEAGFSSQKHFIGVYILKQTAFRQFIHELKGVSFGKGVIRFTKPGDINFKVVQKMLKASFDSPEIICG
jgi:uncharacterized protein YdhG (YjbR/CyaY superfamily)